MIHPSLARERRGASQLSHSTRSPARLAGSRHGVLSRQSILVEPAMPNSFVGEATP
jgi:hypothetical protein